MQVDGGPCAVIAPVQAFILKQLLLESDVITWKAIETEKCDRLLVKAMTEIITQAADVQHPKYSVVHANESNACIVNKDASVSKATESIVNSTPDISEDNQVSKKQIKKQELLESEFFHSQLRYVYIMRFLTNYIVFQYYVINYILLYQDIHYK